MSRSLALMITAAALCVATPVSAAVSPFVGAPVPDTTRTDTFAQAGFGFYAAADGTSVVNRLGYWAPGGSVTVDHDVALFNFNGANYTQIASATISAGTVADANGFVWAPIPAMLLTDTQQGLDFYVVTASNGTDVWAPFTGQSNAPTVDSSFGTRTGNGWFSAAPAPGDGGTAGFNLAAGNEGYVGPNIGVQLRQVQGVTIEDFSSQLVSSPFNRQAVDSINNSGMTGDLHNNNAEDMWLTDGFNSPDPSTAFITYDLGENHVLDEIRVWNYNEATAGLFTRGINEVEIYVSATDSTGDLVKLLNGTDANGNFFFDIANGSPAYAGFFVDLENVTNAELLASVRLVRFDVVSTHGDAQFVGLSEVRFFYGAPTPAALPAGLALLGLGAARRRRHR